MENCFCLRVLHWNAGSLSQTKKSELEAKVNQLEVDVFAIVEAGIYDKDIERFNFKNYTIFNLEKTRQTAGGILVGIRDTLTSKFSIVKRMEGGVDKSEIAKIDVWKEGKHFRVFSMYSPPRNRPNFDLVEMGKKTILMGDFNAHSFEWGYDNYNAAGRELENFMSTNQLQLIYESSDTPSYLHYNGSLTNPDLIFVSSDLEDMVRQVLEDPGFGHRMILCTIRCRRGRNACGFERAKKSWNFKKANWGKFSEILENKVTDIDLVNSSADVANRVFCNMVLEAAKETIPNCKAKRFKPFWSEELKLLKKRRDTARITAEMSGIIEDVSNWRVLARDFKLELKKSKQQSFTNFVYKFKLQKGQ
ncbi:hypothetical protein JTE90_015537 [Oedothorax gibbosus]|uniref:Endonuclease/exonuclease/phosphatase domain-containing protein n=1 Tax=Oedothorax gibbosus TaxID=931172 RepID=A0AAV6TNE8_9ARAC|nr:hypothetical protein JTE90_015537 [Oedothorax gibbosus]